MPSGNRQPVVDAHLHNGPGYAGFVKSFPFARVNPYLAYAGRGGRLDSEGVPLFQQAFVDQITPKQCLDRFAEVLTKNM